MKFSTPHVEFSTQPGYLLLPRSITYALFGQDEKKYQKAKILFVLITSCFYKGRYVTYNGYRHFCDRGEFIGTYERIACHARVKEFTVKRILKDLKTKGIINIKRINGGSHIRMNSYIEFLEEVESKGTADVSSSGNTPVDTDKNHPRIPTPEELAAIERARGEYKF